MSEIQSCMFAVIGSFYKKILIKGKDAEKIIINTNPFLQAN